MKKLMTLAVVGLAAAIANAATITWGANKGYLYEAGTTTKITSGEAYLMVVTTAYSQDNLVSAFSSASGDASATITAMTSSGALATGTGTIGSNARIAEASSTYTLTGDASVYFVVFNGSEMYISAAKDAAWDSVTDSALVAFDAMSTTSKAAAMDAASGYAGAGWYAAVPEPTSGLLMLLGVAGLALRRRRA